MITNEMFEVDWGFLVDCMQEYMVMDPTADTYEDCTKFMYTVTATWVVQGAKNITQPELWQLLEEEAVNPQMTAERHTIH